VDPDQVNENKGATPARLLIAERVPFERLGPATALKPETVIEGRQTYSKSVFRTIETVITLLSHGKGDVCHALEPIRFSKPTLIGHVESETAGIADETPKVLAPEVSPTIDTAAQD